MSQIVTLFGSAHPREGAAEYETAFEMGNILASAGFTICNGGYGGIMEASARGAKSAGGKTIGVTLAYVERLPNAWIDDVKPAESLCDRLQTLLNLGNAYIVMRGGTGTLLELAAAWEFINKELMELKPIVALGSFWNPVIDTVRIQLLQEGSTAADAVHLAATPQQCIEYLRTRLAK